MSHDMDVPITDEALTYRELLVRLEQKWASLRPRDPMNLTLSIQDSNPDAETREIQIGEKEAQIEIRVSGDCCAGCMLWHHEHWSGASDLENSRVQANVWAWRNPESTLVMSLVASCIAEATQTFVIDEWGIFAKGRIVQSSVIDATLASVADLPLSAAGQTLFGLWA